MTVNVITLVPVDDDTPYECTYGDCTASGTGQGWYFVLVAMPLEEPDGDAKAEWYGDVVCVEHSKVDGDQLAIAFDPRIP